MKKKWGYKDKWVGFGEIGTRANGCTYAHRLVAEEKLGRKLSSDEVVHHIDGNRANNVPENIMVFASSSHHARFHKNGVAIIQPDGAYQSPQFTRVVDGEWLTNTCLGCGAVCRYKYCSYSCARLASRKVERPDRETLRRLIEKNSFVSLGKIFGVSDNAVRKWAKCYGLEFKKKINIR